MAIKKILWKKLMTNVTASQLFTDIEDILKGLDDSLNAKLGQEEESNLYEEENLYDLCHFISSKVVTDSNDGIWKELPIYISSYKEYDERDILLLKNKLREYVGFYKKILDDEGLQRHLVYAKSYGNDGNTTSNDRGIDSSVPQNSNLYDPLTPDSDATFDQAIADYASAISKNKAKTTSHTEGTSDTTVSGATWEESKKNVQMFFYNELKDFIYSLPERIYSMYSLSTIPAPELCKRFFEHLHEVREMLENE